MKRIWGIAPKLLRRQAKRSGKIVATIGPASQNAATLTKMVHQGLDVVRLNFSHGSHEEHLAAIKLIRHVEKDCNKPLAILMDLCGPKVNHFFVGANFTFPENVAHKLLQCMT